MKIMMRADSVSGEASFPIDSLLTVPSCGGRGKLALWGPSVRTLIPFRRALDFKT